MEAYNLYYNSSVNFYGLKLIWAMGEVVSIIYHCNNLPPALPIAVLVKFDNYIGPTYLGTNTVPITPVSLLSSTGEHLDRQQVPLKLNWAFHKYQGLTL